MEVVRIDSSDKKEVSAFLRLPFEIYRHDKKWVPPFPGQSTSLPGHGDTFLQSHEHACFIVRSSTELLGRIAVTCSIHPVEESASQTGFFGYCDFVEDESAFRQLFAAVEDWSAANHQKRLFGPFDFSGASANGVLIEGFDSIPITGSPYNLPFYQTAFENSGYAKKEDFYTGLISQPITSKLLQIAEKVRARNHFTLITPTTENEYLEWYPRCKHAFTNQSPRPESSQEEIIDFVKNIYAQSNPESFTLLLHGEEIAGYSLTLPDISATLQKTHGHSDLLSIANQRIEKNNTRLFSLIEYGILPEYLGLGANVLLSAELNRFLHINGKSHLAILQIPEKDHGKIQDFEMLGASWIKKHRIYSKDL